MSTDPTAFEWFEPLSLAKLNEMILGLKKPVPDIAHIDEILDWIAAYPTQQHSEG